MIAVKKKPGLAALVIGMGKPKAGDEPDGDEGYDDDYDAAADEFLDAIGIEEAKRPAAKEAFKAAVMSCK